MSEIYIKYENNMSEVKDILQKALDKIDTNIDTQEFKDKYLKDIKLNLDIAVENTFTNMISEIETALITEDDLIDK